MKKQQSLVLFNNSLRLSDHEALYHASSKYMVIAAYIFDEKLGREKGSSSLWWLHHSLKKLRTSLEERQTQLVLRRGSLLKNIEKLIKEIEPAALYITLPSDPREQKHFLSIQKFATNLGVAVNIYSPNLLVDPTNIHSKSGGYFKVFTPFWKQCLKVLAPDKPLPIPSWQPAPLLDSEELSDWGLLKNLTCKSLDITWEPGEAAAKNHLKKFIKDNLANYDTNRNRIDLDGTSKLSAYLRSGEIGIREIWHETSKYQKEAHKRGADTFINELGFREFSHYLLHHFPNLDDTNFRKEYDHFKWENDEKLLEAWKNGKTGYPIIDAGMRQLKATGWMHNRLRMIVGSFLTKDLLIDWRQGEAWFWDCLLDADPALNAFNWQWVAGTGADAAPYFRVFNPTLQGEKFDPQGTYIKTWVEELKNLQGKSMHAPSKLDPIDLSLGNVQLGKNYPYPIVDHTKARDKALLLYKKLRNTQ